MNGLAMKRGDEENKCVCVPRVGGEFGGTGRSCKPTAMVTAAAWRVRKPHPLRVQDGSVEGKKEGEPRGKPAIHGDLCFRKRGDARGLSQAG